MRVVVMLAMLAVACKADSPATSAASGSAPPIESLGSGPTGSDASLGSLMPTIEGAKVLRMKSASPDHTVAIWCIDEPDAVARIKAALARDHWEDIRTRGTGRIAIAAARGEARFSAILGGTDTRCAGVAVTATVMRLGDVTLPTLSGDDRIR